MTAYQKAVELGLTGSDAEIVAVLQTLGSRDVPVLEVATWLRERGLLVVGFRGTTGSLVAFYDQCSDAAIKAGLDEFFASVVGRQAATVRFTDPQIAGRVYSIATQLLPQVGGDAAMLESFYAMSGGQPYAALTVEQFTAERDAATIEAARQVAYSEIVRRANEATSAAAAMLDSGATAEEITAAGFTGWQGAEATQ